MIAIGAAGAILGAWMVWAWLSPRGRAQPLPNLWAISPRPVFNANERRLYRQLREAFPQHVVMPKLPLVRLCQPDVQEQVQYWYGLLGSTHATFTVCSSSGKALLAIDLESRRSRSKRNLEIKEAVLKACQIKYFSIAANGMPTVAALQLLLPHTGSEAPSAVTRDDVARGPVGESINEPFASTRPSSSQPLKGTGRWQDSSVFMDSFFSPDSRMDPGGDVDLPNGASESTAPSSAAGH